jgi:hypothetical protein
MLQDIIVFAIIISAAAYVFYAIWNIVAKKNASACQGCAAKELCHQKLQQPIDKKSDCCQ